MQLRLQQQKMGSPQIVASCRMPAGLSTEPQQQQERYSSTTSSTSKEPSNSSMYDTSDNWRDWFAPAEYQNPWQDGDTFCLYPLNIPQLDRESRFVLQLLQDMYHNGLTKTTDRVTKERCRRILTRLAEEPTLSHTTTIALQTAKRADAILQAMELFLDLQRQYETTPLPLTLPVPDYEFYWTVLRLYASKFLKGNKEIPLRCHEIVSAMQDSGQLELQPTIVHWNQVLCAWANSNDNERSVQAAQLLQSLHAQHLTDASSFSHTLRACVSVANQGQGRDAKFSTLAGKVAIRVWGVLQEQDETSPHAIRIDSYLYVHFLRAVQNIPDQTEAIFERTFQECCQRGKVNPHVLRELQAVASPQLQSKLLGMKLSKNSSQDPLKLIRKLPQEWIEHADGNRYGW
jgi:hypothetical protein